MADRLEFKTELKQLLHLITHSLYSDKDIFLRELICNASDAINKVRFDSLDNDDKLEGNKDWKIALAFDKDAGTLTVSDNGVGMSRDAVVDHLGTIAKSGTKAFLEALSQSDAGAKPDLIGQFGVGFYSAFMVADKVTVVTRPGRSTPADGVRWESDGQGEFTVEAYEKATRGTDVTLHLKDDDKDFLDPYRLRRSSRSSPTSSSSPSSWPSRTARREKRSTRSKAIWLRLKSEVNAGRVRRVLQADRQRYGGAGQVVHYTAEGKQEFRVLVFVPRKRPFSFMWGEPKGMKLYVRGC